MSAGEVEPLELFVTLRANLVAIQKALLALPGTNKLHARLVSDICERVNELETLLVAVMRKEIV